MTSSSAHESSTVPILSKNRYFLNFLSLRWRHSINFFSFFFQNFRSVSDAYSIYHFKNRFTKLFLKGDSFLIKNFSRPSSIPQVIAAIAGAELPNGHWGEVIQALATNATDVWINCFNIRMNYTFFRKKPQRDSSEQKKPPSKLLVTFAATSNQSSWVPSQTLFLPPFAPDL